MRFHHNLVENVTDDGVFLTAGTAYDGETQGGDVHIYQNRFARILTTFAFGVGHGRQKMTEKGKQTGSGVWIYRNVFDFRRPVWYTWPSGPGRSAGDHLPRPLCQRPRQPHLGADVDLSQHDPRRRHAALRLRLRRADPRPGPRHVAAGVQQHRLPDRRNARHHAAASRTPIFEADGNLFWSLKPDKPLSDEPVCQVSGESGV